MSAPGRATTIGPPGIKLDPVTKAQLLLDAGASPDQASILTAISGHEDPSGVINALNDNPSTGDYSVGEWQVNYYGNLLPGRTASYGSPSKLATDPLAQAKAAVAISGGPSGANFSPWTTFKNLTPDEIAASSQAVAAAGSSLGKTGLLADPNLAGKILNQGLTAPSGSPDYTPSGGLVDPNSAWHSVLLNLDGILNNKPSGSNPVSQAINLLNPVNDLRVILARSGVVLGGLIVSVFGLLIITESIAGKAGVTAAAGVVPGGKFAAAALAPKTAAKEAGSNRTRKRSEERKESDHQESMRRADEKAQASRDRNRYKSASKPKSEEPF